MKQDYRRQPTWRPGLPEDQGIVVFDEGYFTYDQLNEAVCRALNLPYPPDTPPSNLEQECDPPTPPDAPTRSDCVFPSQSPTEQPQNTTEPIVRSLVRRWWRVIVGVGGCK